MIIANFKALKNQIKETEEFRNAVAHGVWLKHDQTALPMLQITRNLKLFPKFSGGYPTKAKVDPRAMPLTLEALRVVVDRIDTVAKICDQLFVGVGQGLAATTQSAKTGTGKKRAQNEGNR